MAHIERDTPPPLPRLALNTLENARKSYARLIRGYMAGKIPEPIFKAVCYGLSGFLGYWREEKSIELERRIEMIEQSIRSQI